MKAKTVLIVLIVALLCTSIASAGFTDWVTGKAISLRSLFSKNTATKAEITNSGITNNNAANLPAAGKNTAAKISDNSPAEWDTSVKAYKGDALLVHTENILRQFKATLNLVEKKWDSNPAAWDSNPAGAAK